MRIHKPLLAVALVAAAGVSLGSSCNEPGGPAISTDESEIDLSRCAAWRFKCPEVRGKCNRNWNTKTYAGGALRDPAWGPCQPPPAGGCTQVILGNFGSPPGLPLPESVKGYIGCPGYVVESQDPWSQYLNDRFMACVITGQVGATCTPSIKVVTRQGDIPEPGPGQRTTTREICQMLACGCDVKVVGNEVKVGACPPPKPGKPETTATASADDAVAAMDLAADDDDAFDDSDAVATTDETLCEPCASGVAADGKAAGGNATAPVCGSCATTLSPNCHANGASCSTGGDCCSQSCSAAGQCQAPVDPTGCRDEGAGCESNADCCQGSCDSTTHSCIRPTCSAGTPCPSPTPGPSPTPNPTPNPTPSPTPSATPFPTPNPTPFATATPRPNVTL